jgi:hypothetical protein
MSKSVYYNFNAAQGFKTSTGGTKNDIVDNLKTAALNLVNAMWDDKNRSDLIYWAQCAATDAIDFLDCIIEMEVEQ